MDEVLEWKATHHEDTKIAKWHGLNIALHNNDNVEKTELEIFNRDGDVIRRKFFQSDELAKEWVQMLEITLTFRDVGEGVGNTHVAFIS